jgi:hypothetical protein
LLPMPGIMGYIAGSAGNAPAGLLCLARSSFSSNLDHFDTILPWFALLAQRHAPRCQDTCFRIFRPRSTPAARTDSIFEALQETTGVHCDCA